MKYDVFISYRREGGFEIANLIASKLRSSGYRVFLDLHAMHSGDFSEQLKSKVKECKDFIWILSANTESNTLSFREGVDYYRDEICWAIESKSNIVPVKLEGFVFPNSMPECIEEAIQSHNRNLNIYQLQTVEAIKNQFFDAAILELRRYLTSKPVVLYKFVAAAMILLMTVAASLVCLTVRNSECTCVIQFREEKNNLPFDGVDVELIVGSTSLGVKHLYSFDDEIIYTGMLRNKFNDCAVVKCSGRGFKEIHDTVKLEQKMIINLERDNSFSDYWGYIYDSETDEPLEGVQVVLGKDFTAYTNEQGLFSFSLPIGAQELYKDMRASKQGYRSFFDSEVYPGETKFHMVKF